jgi:hypothetical protein
VDHSLWATIATSPVLGLHVLAHSTLLCHTILPVFCSMILFAFPCLLLVVKAISTIGFILTLIIIFFVVVVFLWVCYCNCFFVGLQIELLDILKFVALLAPHQRLLGGHPYGLQVACRPPLSF